MSRPYVLPNRKAFADAITRTFLKYREIQRGPVDPEDAEVDACLVRTNAREMLPHQKIIRDYMLIETPYRGILVYHGLGSGKTCSSIAVAESLLTTQKVFVMLPASLESNYRGELRKCGDPLYVYDQHWRERALNEETRAEAKALGISDAFLDKHTKFFVTIPGEQANFGGLAKVTQDTIGKQIEDIIDQRFTFIRYNGLSSNNIQTYAPEEGNPYDDAVVIIDEAHNFISRIVNKSDIAWKLYDKLYNAKRCKIVCLSGTPIINRPREIAFMMNLLRGPIERISIPTKTITTWDEEKISTVLRAIPDIDTIEFNAVKKIIMVTRNPPSFRSVYNEKGDRIAVQYVKDMPYIEVARDWVATIKGTVETGVGGAELDMERITTEALQCLPTEFEEFSALFLDGLNIKNPLLFQRRIQGLVSYFKGADERLLPKRVDDERMLEKVPMSAEQFGRYLEVRKIEIEVESNKATRSPMDDDKGMFRVLSRLACNFAIPPELLTASTAQEGTTEDTVPEKPEILARLQAAPDRYLSEQGLAMWSPKMLRMLQNVKAAMGTDGEWKNQFVYSQYRSLEGTGVFAAILDAHGWQPYKIVKENNQWVEDPAMDPAKPAYAFYIGGKAEEREMMRQVFNAKYQDDFPASLKASVEARGKKLLCLLMATSSGAEGITLANVRHVHIMEPHWTPARHDQVIGRAIRICSHASLPQEERTVRISFYISVFTEEQARSTKDNNVVLIRRKDVSMKRYEGTPVEAFMSTDEYLYEATYEKDKVNSRIATLLKQSAVDCEIHRKLHGKESPVLSCMRFDSTTTGEDLAFRPSTKNDDLDATYLRNTTRKRRRLQKVLIKQMVFLIDMDTKQVFDGPAFEDENRLVLLGLQTTPTQIRWSTGMTTADLGAA
jgi:hypothetical protein